MMGWIGSGTELLLQAARSLPDTIYTKQVVAEPGLWSKITSVASGVMTITVIILTASLVPAAWNFRKSYKKVSDMLDKIYGDINPLEVVQEEAESAFVTTASTIRGVQTGINQAFDEEDWNDGDNDEDRADDEDGADRGEKPRPRVRPRNRAGRGA